LETCVPELIDEEVPSHVWLNRSGIQSSLFLHFKPSRKRWRRQQQEDEKQRLWLFFRHYG
jgi:hypothetical protein